MRPVGSIPACLVAVAAIFVCRASVTEANTAPPSGTQPALLSFVRFDKGLPTSGQWREGFRIADMNGDGHPDIVHGPARKQPGAPIIFLGDGRGSWAQWRDAKFPPLDYDYGDVEVADFNGDGHPDIALAAHLHGFFVLMGDGHGKFSDGSAGLESNAAGAPGFSSRAIRATDWNGDRLPDLLAVSEGAGSGNSLAPADREGIVVHLNRGASGWEKGGQTLSKGIYSDSITLGDFDGDGHLDVATGSGVMGRNDLVHLWRGHGAAAPLALDLQGAHQFVQAVSAGDFDNDGRDDLAVAYVRMEHDIWSSGIDIFYSRSGGKWERRALYTEPGKQAPYAMASGHLRSKSAGDLVALTGRGETLVFLGDGHGALVRNSIPLPVYGGACRGAHVEMADLDGDGHDEIVASFADEPATFGTAADSCSSGGGITAWKAVIERK